MGRRHVLSDWTSEVYINTLHKLYFYNYRLKIVNYRYTKTEGLRKK